MCLISIDITCRSCMTLARGFVRGSATLSSNATLHIHHPMVITSESIYIHIYSTVGTSVGTQSHLVSFLSPQGNHQNYLRHKFYGSRLHATNLMFVESVIVLYLEPFQLTMLPFRRKTYSNCDLKHLGWFGKRAPV